MRSTTTCGVGTYGTRASAAQVSVATNVVRKAAALTTRSANATESFSHDMDCTAGFPGFPPRARDGGGLYSESGKWRIIPDYHFSYGPAVRHPFHVRRRDTRAGTARLAHPDALLRREPLHLDRHTLDHAGSARPRLLGRRPPCDWQEYCSGQAGPVVRTVAGARRFRHRRSLSRLSLFVSA